MHSLFKWVRSALCSDIFPKSMCSDCMMTNWQMRILCKHAVQQLQYLIHAKVLKCFWPIQALLLFLHADNGTNLGLGSPTILSSYRQLTICAAFSMEPHILTIWGTPLILAQWKMRNLRAQTWSPPYFRPISLRKVLNGFRIVDDSVFLLKDSSSNLATGIICKKHDHACDIA